jgi:hypothetical protein
VRITNIPRDLWELSGYRPESFWRAMAVSFLWAILIYATSVLVSIAIYLARLAVGLSYSHPVYGAPNFGVLWFLPLLPLLWIGVSRNVNILLSLLGLVLLWAIAFWPRKVMDMVLSDAELARVAGAYMFVWTGNRLSYYWERKRRHE